MISQNIKTFKSGFQTSIQTSINWLRLLIQGRFCRRLEGSF